MNKIPRETKEDVRSSMRQALDKLSIRYTERTKHKANQFDRSTVFDFSIIHNNNTVAIIQLKRPYAKDYNNTNGRVMNTKRYSQSQKFGIPVIYCIGSSQIDQSINQLISILRPQSNSW